MPLENATYISQLEVSNPAPTDELRQADDHIRLIKAALKATFPNINAAVTISSDQLNAISANLSAAAIPIGSISLWYGSASNLPVGWAECNGQTVSRTDNQGTITTPDLRGKVAIGAVTGTYTQGQTYGSATATGNTGQGGAHTHTVNGGSHTHGLNVNGTTGATSAPITETDRDVDGTGSGNSRALTDVTSAPHSHSFAVSGNTSADGGHTHDVSQAADHTHSVSVSTLQPSLALHYIMKH